MLVAAGEAEVSLSAPALRVRPLDAPDGGWTEAGGRARVRLRGGRVDAGRGLPASAAGLALSSPGVIALGGRALAPEVEVRRGKAGLDVIEVIPMERYVAGVLAGEMPASFPVEALRAQAVAARTFALVRKLEAQANGRPWDLGVDVLSQVYAGATAPPAARAAAEATEGEVLVLGMEPVEAYFHAVCGGRTEGGLAALGRDFPYLAPVECGHCDGAPRVAWEVAVPLAELGRLAGLPGRATRVAVAARTPTGRAAQVELAAGERRAVLAAADLRRRLGWARLPSLAFDVAARGGEAVFTGRGRGHGAGLCQWGAAGLARAGADHAAILRHYYPGADVVKMY